MPKGYDVEWTDELEQKTIELVSQGLSLKKIAEATGVSTSAMFYHRRQSKTFEKAYNLAQEQGFEHDADKLKTAHEDIPDPLKARLFSENNRWLLSRRAASKYGDRLDITVGQTVDMSQALIDARKRAGHSVQYFDAEVINRASDKAKQIVDASANSETASVETASVETASVDAHSIARQKNIALKDIL